MPLQPVLVEQCARLAAAYPESSAALLPVLHLVQKAEGHLSVAVLEEVASLLGLPPAQVWGVVSFYPAFRTQKTGRLIKVCTTQTCARMGAGEVLSCLRSRLGIEVGKTSADGRFTLEEVRCLASCATAPVMVVDGQLHQSLTSERIDQIVERLD